VQIHCGDAMALLPATSLRTMIRPFDHVFADLPYSRRVHAKAVSCANDGQAAAAAGERVRVRDLGFGYLTPQLRRYTAQACAAATGYSLLYSDLQSAAWLRIACQAAGAEYVREVPWVRWSMAQLSADRPPSGAEMILLVHGQDIGPRGGVRPRPKVWYGPGWLTAFDHVCMRGSDKHPTEKPLAQALDFVHMFSRPGEIIYVPCSGSGSVELACAMLGRAAVGVELQPEHHERSTARLAAWVERRELSPRDGEQLARWRQALDARAAHIAGLVGDHKKQAIRCLDAMAEDRMVLGSLLK